MFSTRRLPFSSSLDSLLGSDRFRFIWRQPSVRPGNGTRPNNIFEGLSKSTSKLGDEYNLAVDYSNLSLIFKDRGVLQEAERWLRKAIEIDERLGNQPQLAIRYNNLSLIHSARGELQEAERWLRKAIEIDELLRDEPKLAVDYSNLSEINPAMGELQEAERWLSKAIALGEHRGPSNLLDALTANRAALQKELETK
jgi:tetratricopeptide (TPR) repeat protein